MNTIKQGDIFVTSWGYDQTNYDYIVVVGVSPTGKTATCKRAIAERVGYSSQCNIQKPTNTPYGLPFRMKVAQDYHGNVCLKGSYIFCGGEDSTSKRFDTFHMAETNRIYHETDSMFGH